MGDQEFRAIVFSVIIVAMLAAAVTTPTGLTSSTVSISRYTDGSFVKSLDVILDKEYTVSKIDFEGTPGGEYCGAKIGAKAYDAAGKSTDLGATSWVNAHKTATKSVTFATPVKVKKVNGKPLPDSNMFTSDCSYIDHLKVTLYYTVTTNALSIKKTGTGSGTVTSSPAGISCGSDCSEEYSKDTSVTLTATPATGSKFIGWSGSCTGTKTTCTFTMDTEKTATANFSDTIPPNISIFTPQRNAVTYFPIYFFFSASDNVGVSSVKLYVDGSELPAQNYIKSQGDIKSATANGGKISRDLLGYVYGDQISNGISKGVHTYYAIATDTSGNTMRDPLTGTKSFNVSLDKPSVTTISTVLSPANAKVGQAFTITESAYDVAAIAEMGIYVDDKLVAKCQQIYSESGTCSYTTTYSTKGTHTYYAWATGFGQSSNSKRLPTQPAPQVKSFTVG